MCVRWFSVRRKSWTFGLFTPVAPHNPGHCIFSCLFRRYSHIETSIHLCKHRRRKNGRWFVFCWAVKKKKNKSSHMGVYLVPFVFPLPSWKALSATYAKNQHTRWQPGKLQVEEALWDEIAAPLHRLLQHDLTVCLLRVSCPRIGYHENNLLLSFQSLKSLPHRRSGSHTRRIWPNSSYPRREPLEGKKEVQCRFGQPNPRCHTRPCCACVVASRIGELTIFPLFCRVFDILLLCVCRVFRHFHQNKEIESVISRRHHSLFYFSLPVYALLGIEIGGCTKSHTHLLTL